MCFIFFGLKAAREGSSWLFESTKTSILCDFVAHELRLTLRVSKLNLYQIQFQDVPCHIAAWGFHCSTPWLVWESWDSDRKTWILCAILGFQWRLQDKSILDEQRDVTFPLRSNKALLRHFCNQAAVDISPYSLEVWQSKTAAWSLKSNKACLCSFECFPGWKPG